jgi:hypothetical protein
LTGSIHFLDRTPAVTFDRLRALGAVSPETRARTEQFLQIAKQGLPQMYRKGAFVHTVRSDKANGVRPEGDSLRYAIDVALGLSFISKDEQRKILGGDTAADLLNLTTARAEFSVDPGAVALAAWAAAEASDIFAGSLLRRLTDLLQSGAPVYNVDCAWALKAALAARHLGDTEDLIRLARDRLLGSQSESGLFPHRLPDSSNGRLRSHVGCFADQVYAIQAFSRLSIANGDEAALRAAEKCAARICELQGPDGQWWWHYDVRNGTVVEGYPVYSVHQHAMAPMALLDLREAGGKDHMDAVIKGLRWIDTHPEVDVPLVDEANHVIWRKAARREPNKAVRALSAFTTALRPGLRLPGLDALFPPCRVDYECRPYEFGWMLYAWLSGGTIARLRRHRDDAAAANS